MEEKISKRGGKRAGAGRPAGIKTTQICLKLRNELLDYVNSKPNKNGFINDCIEERMKRELEEQ